MRSRASLRGDMRRNTLIAICVALFVCLAAGFASAQCNGKWTTYDACAFDYSVGVRESNAEHPTFVPPRCPLSFVGSHSSFKTFRSAWEISRMRFAFLTTDAFSPSLLPFLFPNEFFSFFRNTAGAEPG